jgi:LmbE family N-acetylglucosaminyl deacetylase
MFDNTKKVLAIFAHPDDAELLCFGLLMKLAAMSVSVKVLIVSDGARGVAVGEDAQAELARVRMDETRAALSPVTQDVETLSFPDGGLRLDGETVSAIEASIQRTQPDLVVTHFCDPSGTDHHDHGIVAAAVRNICYRKSYVKTLLSCEPLQPFTDFVPTLFVNIVSQFDSKCAALALHASQGGRAYLTEGFHRARGERWAGLARAGLMGAVFEAFRVEKMVVD